MNAVRIEQKVANLRWKYSEAGNGFVGKMEITRKPFGVFTVEIGVNPTDGTYSVTVTSEQYGGLHWGKTCRSMQEVIQAVEDRFESIEELAEQMQERFKEIEEYARRSVDEVIRLYRPIEDGDSHEQ